MRVVIDTNVFVGACIGAGASNAVIRACLQHRLVPLMGEALLAEFDAETRFRLRAARGAGQEALGLKLLDKAMAA